MKKSFAIVCVLVSCLWIGACAEGQMQGPPGPDAATAPDGNGGMFPDANPFIPDARVFPDANTSFPDANTTFPDSGNTGGTCTQDSDCGAPPNCCDLLLTMTCGTIDPMFPICLPSGL